MRKMTAVIAGAIATLATTVAVTAGAFSSESGRLGSGPDWLQQITSAASERQSSPAQSSGARQSARVVDVVDGDTIRVSYGGSEHRVRLLNIDTPETKHPDKGVQCMGPEASELAKELMPIGTQVELEYDKQRTDRYGRELAGVWLDADTLVNEQIAAAGLAEPTYYSPNYRFSDRIEAAADKARQQGLGLYSSALPCTPGGPSQR